MQHSDCSPSLRQPCNTHCKRHHALWGGLTHQVTEVAPSPTCMLDKNFLDWLQTDKKDPNYDDSDTGADFKGEDDEE